MLKNLSHFNEVSDYLPIISAALIVDMIVISRIVFGQINIKSLNKWYNKFGLLAVVADVLSIVLGIIFARFLYPLLFKKYSLILFLLLTCSIQLIHDCLFYLFFSMIPRNKSSILDIFKDYGKEVGVTILFVDSLMMISTVIIGSFLATMNINSIIVILIISLYILPYLLYSIPSSGLKTM